MAIKKYVGLTYLILLCCGGMTARSDELGNLSDREYSKLCAEHNIEAIKTLLRKERCVESNAVEVVFRGIADDLWIVNKHDYPKDVQSVALELLLQDKYLIRCPTGDVRTSIWYFETKKNVLMSGLNLSDFYNSPKNRKCLDEFMAEVKDMKVCDYKLQGTSRPGLDVLIKAGVGSRYELTNALFKTMYDEAVRVNQQQLNMNNLQRLLDRIDRIFKFQKEHRDSFNKNSSDGRQQE